jgi:hypothetical protein
MATHFDSDQTNERTVLMKRENKFSIQEDQRELSRTASFGVTCPTLPPVLPQKKETSMRARNICAKNGDQFMTLKPRTDTDADPSKLQTRNFQTHPGLETPLRKTETSHPKLRHLAPLSTSYANFSLRQAILSKTETGVLRFRAPKLENPGLAHSLLNWLLEIDPCSPPLRNDPETIPETFQAVSRNAETLALQINHLRELDLETIKKSLKQFGAPRKVCGALIWI